MIIRKVLITCLVAISALSGLYSYPVFHDEVSDVLHLLYSGEYVKALNGAEEITGKFPESNAGQFLKAGIFSTYMSDFETDTLNDSLLRCCNSIISGKDSKDAFETFFKGGALLYKAYYYADRGLYPSAISHGLKSLDYFNKAIDLDTALYDAYLGRGLVKYFIYKFKDKVPFVKADLNGLDEIALSADRGLFSKIPAYDMLCILYGMEGMNIEAEKRIGELRMEYPDNRMFMYTEYKIYSAQKDYKRAAEVLRILKTNVEETQKHTYYNLMYVYSNLADVYYEMGMTDSAQLYAEKTLNYRDEAKKEQRLKGFIKDAERIIKRTGVKN